MKLLKTITETVSGSLPLDKRATMKAMLEEAGTNGIKHIFVESARAVARNMDTAEEIYRKACDLGIHIIPSDMPDLFLPNATPIQKFVRRIVLAMTELEKDLVVSRLSDGRARAREKRTASIKRARQSPCRIRIASRHHKARRCAFRPQPMRQAHGFTTTPDQGCHQKPIRWHDRVGGGCRRNCPTFSR